MYHGTESVSFPSPKIWDISPDRLKKLDSQGDFKTAINVGSLRNVREDSPRYIFTMAFLSKKT